MQFTEKPQEKLLDDVTVCGIIAFILMLYVVFLSYMIYFKKL